MFSSRELMNPDDNSDEKSDADSALEEGMTLLDLKEQLAQVQKDKAILEVELSKWENKTEKVKHEIHQKEAEEHALQDKIENDGSKSQAGDGDDDNPPGPDSLEWVDGACFNFFSMFVVFVNVTVMVLKHFWDPMTEISGELWYFDQAFLIFYIIELSLRFVLWRDQLLFHRPISKTWSYWLDTIVVVTSIIEQWILPFFVDVGGGGFGFLRILRIFRFFRVLRIVGKIKLIDLAENDWFLAFMMAVIFLNCIVMGVQEDYPKLGCWIYFENFFLGLFFFELVIKLNHFGSSFFCNDQWIYNWLDLVIVVGGCFDTWFLPIFNFLASEAGEKEEGSKALGHAMNILRMLRLVRLLRLIRLVRGIPQLYNLLKGIIEAMQGMLWLLVLTTAVIYIIAIVVMMLWGKDGLVTSEDSQEIRDVFPSVGKTMWTLFMAMNGDPGGMQPLFDAYPGTLVFAAGYMIFTSFAILSVLTGVVADKMATAAEDHSKEIEDEAQRKHDLHTSMYLERIYTAYSENGTGGITHKTYKAILEDEDLAQELCEILNMEMPELEDAWEGMKKEPRRNMMGPPVDIVSEDNFKDGLMKAHGSVENLSISRVYQKLRTIEKKLDGRQ